MHSVQECSMGPSASETKTAQSVALSPQCYHIRTSLAGKFLIYAVIFSLFSPPLPLAGTDKALISRCRCVLVCVCLCYHCSFQTLNRGYTHTHTHTHRKKDLHCACGGVYLWSNINNNVIVCVWTCVCVFELCVCELCVCLCVCLLMSNWGQPLRSSRLQSKHRGRLFLFFPCGVVWGDI